MDDATAERLTENEYRFRDINERLGTDIAPVAGEEERIPFVCECSHTSCREIIELTVEEYQGLRRTKDRFAVVPGHQVPEIEEIVAREDGHLVVEKLRR